MMLLLGTVCAEAQVADLVDHDGFDACWSRALTKTNFLALVETSIEDATPGCEPAGTVGATPYCNASTCADNSAGCPLKVHSGPFEVSTIDLQNEVGKFDTASGSIDGFSMPVTVPIVGECIFTFTNTNPVSLTYSLYYPLRTDGVDGFYTTALPVVSSVLVTGLTGADVTLTGGFLCAAANVGNSFFLDTLRQIFEDQLAQAIPQITDTVGQSVCPLTAP